MVQICKKNMNKVNLFIKQFIYDLLPQIKSYPNRIPFNKLPWAKTKCWVNKVSCIESVTIFSILLYTNATIYWWSYANQADFGLPIKRTQAWAYMWKISHFHSHSALMLLEVIAFGHVQTQSLLLTLRHYALVYVDNTLERSATYIDNLQ